VACEANSSVLPALHLTNNSFAPQLAKHPALWFDGRMRHPALLLLCALVFTGCDTFNKKPKFTVSVHAEGTAEDNPRMIFGDYVGDPPQQVIFKKIPEFSQENVSAFHSFKADDGTNGVALKLDFRGTNSLEMSSRMRSGEVLRSFVNGLGVDYVIVDQPITDGIFTIWRGVPDEVVALMAKKWPPISRSRSAGHGLEMLPTTKKEKRDALRYAEDDLKAEKKEAAKTDAQRAADVQAPSNIAPTKPIRDDGLPANAPQNKISKERGLLLPQPPATGLPQP
jgi:hypothetical protein